MNNNIFQMKGYKICRNLKTLSLKENKDRNIDKINFYVSCCLVSNSAFKTRFIKLNIKIKDKSDSFEY